MAQIYYFPRSGAQRVPAPSRAGLIDKVTTAWHRMLDDLSSPYQPERHYMRGPGPKWHAKHLGQLDTSLHHTVEEIPALPILHFHNP